FPYTTLFRSASGDSASRAQRAVARRRLRAAVRRALARGARDGPDPPGPRSVPTRARALPGGDPRPPLQPGLGQRRGGGADRRHRARAGRATGERAPGNPPPAGNGSPDTEPPRVERPPAAAAAPAGRD